MRVTVTLESEASFKCKIVCHGENHPDITFNGHNLTETKQKADLFFETLIKEYRLAFNKLGI